VWRNDNSNGTDTTWCCGPTDDEPRHQAIDVDAWQSRIIRPEYAEVKASLAEVGYGSVFDMLRTYSGRGSELAPWLEGAEINREFATCGCSILPGSATTRIAARKSGMSADVPNVPRRFVAGSPASLALLTQQIMGQ